jgi:hypothetical protein
MSSEATGKIGLVKVHATENRGFTPEELAERAIERIIQIGDTSAPAIREQARTFRAQIHALLIHYLREAQENERLTIRGKLRMQGKDDLAEIIRRL